MRRSPRTLFFSGALALAIAILPTVALGNHSWGGYHWARTANPFTVKLGDNVSGSWDTLLKQAVSSEWSASTVLDTQVVGGGITGSSCDPTLGRVEVCSANYGDTGWLGLAQIWLYLGSKHIAQGIVENNDFYFGNSSYRYNNSAEMQHVICQEVGHTLGLDHQSTNGASLNTCMDYYHNTSSTDTKSTEPNEGDYDELLCIYDPTFKRQTLTSSDGTHSCRGRGHLDRTNSATFGANGNGLFGASDAAAGGWGRLVATSDGGFASTFVRELGDGRAIVTFVIWAS